MKIHPTVWFLIIKNLIVVAILYESGGLNPVLWWIAISSLLYSMFAVNAVLQLEGALKKPSDA
jgi:hypothetical protein